MYFSDYSGVSCGHFQFPYLHRLRIMFSQVKGAIPVRSWRLAPQLSRVCAQAGAGFAQVIHRCVHREIAVRGPGQGRGTPGARSAGSARWLTLAGFLLHPGPWPGSQMRSFRALDPVFGVRSQRFRAGLAIRTCFRGHLAGEPAPGTPDGCLWRGDGAHLQRSSPCPVLWSCRILVRWNRQLIGSGGRSSPPRAAAGGHAARG